MALPSKPILVVAAVALLAAAGWFGWQHFFASNGAGDATAVATPAPKRTALPGKPKAPGTAAQPGTVAQPGAAAAPTASQPPANPDQLIDEVMAATGLTEQLKGMPEQMVTAIAQGFANEPRIPPALRMEAERIAADAYTVQGFQQRVRDALKSNYDEKRLRAVLAAASTPVAKKMTGLELAKPADAEVAAFAEGLTRNPLPAARQSLLAQLDEASNATALSTELALGAMRAMALGAAGGDAKSAADIDRVMEAQRPALSANMRKGAAIGMAFMYRDASDAELAEYVKTYQTEHGKWFVSTASAAIVEEFKGASGQFGEKLAAAIRSKQPTRPTLAQAGEHAAAPAGAGASSDDLPPMAARPLDSRKRTMDLRSCLELPTTTQIIQCAERGR